MAHRVFSQPCRPVKTQKFFQQQGLALPTVLALSMLCSVLLLACWRNIALSQGWSRSSVERWQLRQAALSGICKAATAIFSPAAQANNNTRLSYPVDDAQWAQLQTRLPVNGCVQGICRPLLHLSNHRSDWLNRTSGASSLPDQGDISLAYWVEILPSTSNASQAGAVFTYRITALAQASGRNTQAAWQAVWQPASNTVNETAVRLADLQTVLELQP